MLKFKTLLAFAKDSVSCMAYFYRDGWCAAPYDVKSPFSHIMGEAFIRFTLYNREWLDEVAEKVVCCVDEDPDDFFEFGYSLADQLSQNEPFMELIAICSFITYIAHIFFVMGKRQFMDKAYFMIAVIFLKLRNRFEASGSWGEFQKFCLEYVEMVIKEGKVQNQTFSDKVPQASEENASCSENPTCISKKSTIMRSKSADSIQNLIGGIPISMNAISKSVSKPKAIDAIPKSTGAIPKSTGAIPKSTGAIPKSTGAIPKSTGAIPKSTGAIRKSIGANPKSTGAIPKSDTIRKSNATTLVFPKSADTAPKLARMITISSGSTTKLTDVILKSTDTTPKLTGLIKETTGPITKLVDEILKAPDTVQKSARGITKSTGSTTEIQKSTAMIPKSENSEPKPADTIINYTDVNRKSKEVLVSSDIVQKSSKLSENISEKQQYKTKPPFSSCSGPVLVKARMINAHTKKNKKCQRLNKKQK